MRTSQAGATPSLHLPARALWLLVALLSGALALAITYAANRTSTLLVGYPGDGPMVKGFYADEPDIGFRYRWTRGEAGISFPGAGGARVRSVELQAQGPRPEDAGTPISMTVALNGHSLSPTSITLSDRLTTYTFDMPPAVSGPPYNLHIASTTFRPSGDNRTLGLKVASATIRQEEGDLNVPPPSTLAWLVVLIAGLAGCVTPFRPLPAGLALTAMAIALAFASTALLPYSAQYIPLPATAATLMGFVVWQRRSLAHFMARMRELRERYALGVWDEEVHPQKVKEKAIDLPAAAMLVALGLYAAVAMWALPQVVWIGHADYAENANVARNIVEGRGFTVDYVAQFYTPHPTLTHPAETWPLLQPLLISPFFALFGPQTWAAKLPNLLILLALAWGVFVLGRKVSSPGVGLLAALFTLLHPYFANAVLYPINDLPFTAIFFALAWLLFEATEREAAGARTASWWQAVVIGLLAALLIWSKPSGAVLLVGLAGWGLAIYVRARRGGRGRVLWGLAAVCLAVFALALLPLLARNLLAFRTPFYSTEGLDAWILRYWPFYEWENIYGYYIGGELPHPRWVIGGKFGYQNLFDAIGVNFRWVWDKGVAGSPEGSEFVIGPLALLGALVGLLTARGRGVRQSVMALASIALYALFVLIYWHFEGRYFQVAMPWLYLLLAGGIVWLAKLLASWLRPAWRPRLALPIAALMAGTLLLPSFGQLAHLLEYDTRPTSFTLAMDWLKGNTLPSDVVMTRDPWELNWYTRSKAVMIPNGDLDTIRRVIRDRGVTILQLGGPTDGIDVSGCPPDAGAPLGSYPTGSRPTLGKLYCGFEMEGFTLAYRNGDLTIYRVER